MNTRVVQELRCFNAALLTPLLCRVVKTFFLDSRRNDDARSLVTMNARSSAIEANNLVRRFGQVTALNDVSLDIREGEFFSLLGPSGCGKTTLLLIIGGLETLDTGTLRICGEDAAHIPPHQRPVNTVFQNYALFPHLSVWDNIAFGLRMKKVADSAIKRRVENVLALAEIKDLADRKPQQISGGQKQRVALARAIVNEPKVLLLDEPLGALDLKLRKQLQVQLHELQRRVGITFIYVTHDQEEALVMSDRVAVMNAGQIEQLDTPSALYERPRTRFVAEFLGACNVFEAKVDSTEWGTMITTGFGQFRLTAACASGTACFGVRPEKIQFHDKDHAHAQNCCAGKIETMVYVGAETQYRVRCAETLLTVVELNATNRGAKAIGESVRLHIPEDAIVALAR